MLKCLNLQKKWRHVADAHWIHCSRRNDDLTQIFVHGECDFTMVDEIDLENQLMFPSGMSGEGSIFSSLGDMIL
ncbi:MAG: hypothetical protein EBT92_18900 [Planctomycetes bacterium]|nr:hypothetical protein [Planctomycetota bacterium]